MFNTLLIANRGEIACRIIRTAKKLGIRCIAVYSAIDEEALHVKLADEAFYLGAAPSQASYLNIDAIITAAKQANAQAIHPGYGFLAENADFAERCHAAGICFIGPSPAAIRAMGDKIAAKQLAAKIGIPVVPGYQTDVQDPDVLLQAAEKIGYPILLKAAAGGGGKGMRLVNSKAEFMSALASAKREAKASFADDRILLEKYLPNARHIEVQIFADQHHNAVHLFERDCSLQRRHQKIIEEAPAPNLATRLRHHLTNAATSLVQAIQYVGAGTVEFLVADEQFYFMEMNTRLQVEHPVTEFITDIDLVEWQIRVAANEPLPLTQSQIVARGHAFEARINAEDPDQQFLPSIGRLTFLQWPKITAQVRVDTGIIVGDAVTIYYDSLLAKIIVFGAEREIALQALRQALAEIAIAGVITNIAFLQTLLNRPAFITGQATTEFIGQQQQQLLKPLALDPLTVLMGALFIITTEQTQAADQAAQSADPQSPWWQRRHWRLNLAEPQIINLWQQDRLCQIAVQRRQSHYQLTFEGQVYRAAVLQQTSHALLMEIDSMTLKATFFADRTQLHVWANGQHWVFRLSMGNHEGHHQEEAATLLVAPMPGTIIAVTAAEGQAVNKGQSLLVLEAMKMEHTLYSPIDGVIKSINYQVGDIVMEGAELLALEEA